jgi:DNA invertase Pin-like site-specific DNA recombinase
MLDYCLKNKGKTGYLVVWKLDRFARSMPDHYAIREMFLKCGVELKSVTEPIGNTPSGNAFEGMAAVMAQFDNEVRTQRTIIGMTDKARDGYWPVKAPWGYTNIEAPELRKKVIIQNPEQAPVVKFLFEEYYRETISLSNLLKKVHALGDVRSTRGRTISKTLLYKILRNPIHCGRVIIEKFGVNVKGRHEPIISEEIFDEVQRILDGGRRSKHPRNRDNPQFPLRGILCGYCGKSISGGNTTNGKNHKRYAYYGCSGKQQCSNPGMRGVHKHDFEDEFTDFLVKITPDDDMLEAQQEAIRVTYEKQSQENFVSSRRFDARLKKLEQEADELLNIKLKGLIDDFTFIRKSDLIRSERSELEFARKDLLSPDAAVESAVEFGTRIIREFPSVWQMLEPGELRVLRNLFFPKNLVYKYPGFQTHELAPIFKLKSSSSDDLNHHVSLASLEWNTIEGMILQWERVFQLVPSGFVLEEA